MKPLHSRTALGNEDKIIRSLNAKKEKKTLKTGRDSKANKEVKMGSVPEKLLESKTCVNETLVDTWLS